MRDVKKEPRENANALKHLYGREMLQRTGRALQKAYPRFPRKRFEAQLTQLEPLEMKPRVRFIRETLRALLPNDYAEALAILLKAAEDQKLKAFDLWPFTDFVAAYGVSDPARSLPALRELTKRFTSEWAVRPFLVQDQSATLGFLIDCARDPHPHVRRWASEGSRPLLPWGERLRSFVQDPAPLLPLLEALRFDPELYVRKSVANHLNDIAKASPALVVRLLARWQAEAGPEHAKKVDWIVRRALRTLIKAGHPEALALVGVSPSVRVELLAFAVSTRVVRLGGALEFSFELRSKSRQPQKLVIDYLMHFVKAHGGTAPKVFKLKAVELAPGARLVVKKRHSLKRITTREYYPGRQGIALQVNGKILARTHWTLKT